MLHYCQSFKKLYEFLKDHGWLIFRALRFICLSLMANIIVCVFPSNWLAGSTFWLWCDVLFCLVFGLPNHMKYKLLFDWQLHSQYKIHGVYMYNALC